LDDAEGQFEVRRVSGCENSNTGKQLGLPIVPVNNKAKILRVLIILQLLLVPLLTANLGAQDHGIPMPTPPTLPATSEENWTVKRFKLDHPTSIYDTWTAKRNKIGDLARGAIVSGLLKLSVVYKPDIVTITAPVPQFGLNVGVHVVLPSGKDTLIARFSPRLVYLFTRDENRAFCFWRKWL
jgi:hypothetical protein